MPTRRTFELIVITVVLLSPALAMVHLWARKHIAVTGNSAGADAARVLKEII